MHQIADYIVCAFYTQTNDCHFVKIMLLFAIHRTFLERIALEEPVSKVSMMEVNIAYFRQTGISYSVPFSLFFVYMVKLNSGKSVIYLPCFSMYLCRPKICCLTTRLTSK